MIEDIKTVFKEHVDYLDWMDESTKKQAKRKVHKKSRLAKNDIYSLECYISKSGSSRWIIIIEIMVTATADPAATTSDATTTSDLSSGLGSGSRSRNSLLKLNYDVFCPMVVHIKLDKNI